MLRLCLRSSTAVLLVALALVGGSGCSKESLVARDGGIDAIDPAACGCQVHGSVLTISMACYCKQYDCTQSPFSLTCSDVSYGIGCGIMEVSTDTIGGPEKWVYNDERTLIGVQLATDDGVFTCPTDPSLQGYSLQAGAFPFEDGGVWFAGCTSVTNCPCVDGKIGSCLSVDAGTSTAADAAAP